MIKVFAVVVVLAVLAVIGYSIVQKYQRRERTEEPIVNLGKLLDAEGSYYDAKHAFTPAVDWTPSEPCAKRPNGVCAPDAADWQHETWRALAFHVDEPFYYQYRVVKKGNGVVIEARADLDGNGKFSSLRRELATDADGGMTGGGLQVDDRLE